MLGHGNWPKLRSHALAIGHYLLRETAASPVGAISLCFDVKGKAMNAEYVYVKALAAGCNGKRATGLT